MMTWPESFFLVGLMLFIDLMVGQLIDVITKYMNYQVRKKQAEGEG